MTTTTGHIDGNLKLDIADFLAKIEAVKQEARNLRGEDIRVDVHANTGAANAAMAATSAAAKAMGQSAESAAERVRRSASDVAAAEVKQAAAMDAARIAAKAEELAAARLEEVQSKRGRTDMQVAAAELALERATMRSAAASEKAKVAGAALADARERSASAAMVEAAADEVAAKGNDKVASSAGRASAHTQLVIAAVVGLTAVAGPATGAVVGLGGALGGLGAAGVLAVVGVVEQIKAGTQAGEQWSAGLQSLKGDMLQLSRTSATGMLGSFQQAVTLINRNLPQLNTEISGFSRILGATTVTALDGAIAALHVLNPLFVQGAHVVQNMANGFESWAQNGGLQQFAAYAQATLPQVIDTIGQLALAILHIGEATAPIGTAVLAVLDGLARAINAIPTPMLTGAAIAATALYVAFLGYKGVTSILDGVGAAATRMGTTVGSLSLKMGAVGVALAALGTVAAYVTDQINKGVPAQASLTNAIKTTTNAADGLKAAFERSGTEKTLWGDYADQLKDLPGLMDHAIAAQNNLGDALSTTFNQKGAYDSLKRYGDALAEVAQSDMPKATSAFSQLVSSQKMTTAQQAQLLEEMPAFRDMLTGIATNMGITASTANLLAIATGKIGPSADAAKLATSAQTAELQRNAAAAGVSVDAMGAVDQTQATMAQQFERATAQMYVQSDAMGLLRQALDSLNGKNLSAAEAQNRFESQLISTTEQIANNGGALEGMSEAAVQNRGSILGLIQSSETAALTLRDQGMASDEVRQRMIDARQTIIDQMVANGMNRDSVTAYIMELYKIPDTIPPTKVEVDKSAAEAAMAELTRQRTVYIEAVYYRANQPDLNGDASGSGRPGVAYGGTIPGLAMGGTAGLVGGVRAVAAAYGITGGTIRGNGSAVSDTAGLYRLAHGEEVVSNMLGQADRNRPLLKMMNRNEPIARVAARANEMAGTQPSTAAPVVVPAPVVRVYVGDEEITGRVRVVVDDALSDRARAGRVEARKAVL